MTNRQQKQKTTREITPHHAQVIRQLIQRGVLKIDIAKAAGMYSHTVKEVEDKRRLFTVQQIKMLCSHFDLLHAFFFTGGQLFKGEYDNIHTSALTKEGRIYYCVFISLGETGYMLTADGWQDFDLVNNPYFLFDNILLGSREDMTAKAQKFIKTIRINDK